MTGQTISEKILSAKSGEDVRAGEYVEARIDATIAHDVTGPLAIEAFEAVTGDDGELYAPETTVFTLDHHAPADGVEAANNHNIVREFAAEYGAHQYEINEGICHQVMVEEGFVEPGSLI
ncbi:MAG: aconitase family protein, partial [Halalkalicoccus sp.]